MKREFERNDKLNYRWNRMMHVIPGELKSIYLEILKCLALIYTLIIMWLKKSHHEF